jgi:hypothetical protein
MLPKGYLYNPNDTLGAKKTCREIREFVWMQPITLLSWSTNFIRELPFPCVTCPLYAYTISVCSNAENADFKWFDWIKTATDLLSLVLGFLQGQEQPEWGALWKALCLEDAPLLARSGIPPTLLYETFSNYLDIALPVVAESSSGDHDT